ncbi:MAG: redoxin family protein [Candidatus Eremiobacteraeota bacterium]|nr:redoxin family protein [Candidatus Eremiobacteraeota bacterium]MBV9263824.1 redoxin family protein [Candidatus Eremiobacteraeota bacterium]
MKTMLHVAATALLLAMSPLAGGAASAAGDRMQSFDGGAAWINSAPLTPQALRGKVVLVDFWEYTCINCLRTLPYLREWYRRYHDHGFVIVGVHTPEFEFTHDPKNVEPATKRLGVVWPVVLDNRMAIWKRYENTVWPHEYLFDPSGRLVESVLGEGAYQQTETKIQALLKSANPGLTLPPVMPLLPQDSYDKPGAVCYPQTAEVLIEHGAVRNAPSGSAPGQDVNFAYESSNPQDGAVYLQGYWRLTPGAAISAESDGHLWLRYHAIQLMAVLRPEEGRAVRVDVEQDGHPIPKADAGTDLRYDASQHSYVLVDQPRAYELLMNARFGNHTLELSPKGGGVGVYDIAFESCEIPK